MTLYITDNVLSRFWKNVDKQDGGCWLWTYPPGTHGYGQLGVKIGTTWAHVLAHRLSYIIANGDITSGLFVCHNCPTGDNKLCVNPGHLFLGTCKDNIRDAIRKGVKIEPPHYSGASASIAKLNDDQAGMVAVAEGTLTEIGDRFGINRTTVAAIKNGKTWKHISFRVPAVEPRGLTHWTIRRAGS